VKDYVVDLDRASAIHKAVGMANEETLVLIAGKGHEDYQIIGKKKRHFDDREVAAQAANCSTPRKPRNRSPVERDACPVSGVN
jgi:UDP-N-acetylmuramoyl-L-alanyl-D-glutamate--2,6-diaminopimelate ligase